MHIIASKNNLQEFSDFHENILELENYQALLWYIHYFTNFYNPLN